MSIRGYEFLSRFGRSPRLRPQSLVRYHSRVVHFRWSFRVEQLRMRTVLVTPANSQQGQRLLIESLELRQLFSGQVFSGQGPLVSLGARTVVTADFNGDGHLDLATPNAPSSSQLAPTFLRIS